MTVVAPLLLSFQCSLLVIPVPRHWDPVSPYDGVMKVADTGFHPRRCHSLLLPTNINGLKSKILQY
ncbi:hypothetical protein [Wolbachia endosymbiont (group A) of Cheilosia soror]|uniref:hypothetical protein n=1 Tax=Wolbachia endosymbiont (group A) of Cheilosia soror TaxID=2953995 RepID=UPI0021F8CA42|nr:hypothetical protein [Wolbachia endosymbiont (group A) of Cheilosia soror]